MTVILEKFPYRYIEMDNLLENGHPDYRIQKFHDWTLKDIETCIFLTIQFNWIMLLKILNIQNG